jgi:hypothetical protein
MGQHTFRFFRAGGFDQVELSRGDDLVHLDELDAKLWVALACPTRGLELDPHTLELLDGDGDGRIRVGDVKQAVRWVCSLLVDPSELFEGRAALPLASIDASSPEGKELRASARRVLANLGKPEASEITPLQTKDNAAIFAGTLFNGDGVVSPEAAEADEATAQAIRDVVAALGGTDDRSGKAGVDRAKVEAFFEQAAAFVAWDAEGARESATMPAGERSAAAHAAWHAVHEKLDDYFTRCALAAMDARGAGALNPAEADLSALGARSLSQRSEALAALPVARIEPNRALPLREGLNPAYVDAIAALRTDCVEPLLGPRETLSETEWRALGERLSAHRAWLASKPASSVESLGAARLRELLEAGAKAKIEALIVKDEALEPEAKAVAAVDKLAHYYAHLASLLRNFVNFADFYGRTERASFQAGTLLLDGRAFDLCLRVTDAGKHASLAGQSMTCLAYCDCARGGEKMSIVAAITNGDAEFLMVGRNGVFIDRRGDEWDATVTSIVEQPISVRQAFWAPYKRVARFVGTQFERFASARDAESNALLEQEAGTLSPAAAAAAPAPAAPPASPAFDVARFTGVLAAVGLAIGAIGTALAAIVSGFLELAWWQMPVAVGGALLVVSGPSMLLATLKLRQRNLGPLLDASGWAINTRARVNVPFGASLTQLAELPPGSTRTLGDPFADKKRPWRTYVVLALVVFGGLYLARHELKRWLRPHLEDVPVMRDWVADEEASPRQAASGPARD